MRKKAVTLDSPVKKEQCERVFNDLINEFMLRDELPLKDLLSLVELRLLVLSLQKSNGNQQKAAHILGIRNTTLHEKLKRYSLSLRKILVFDGNGQN